jgi:hypothetical protein
MLRTFSPALCAALCAASAIDYLVLLRFSTTMSPLVGSEFVAFSFLLK